MTTIRDLLNDFANEIVRSIDRSDVIDRSDFIEKKEELLDEYIETIKERIVG